MGSGQAVNLCVKVIDQLKFCTACAHKQCYIMLLLFPTERIVTCDKLRDPRNGDVDLTGITVGSRAKYSCDRGFDLKGDQVRKCQSNGQWSGSEPICKSKQMFFVLKINLFQTFLFPNKFFFHPEIIVTCAKLSDPRNGNVDLTGLTVGSTAKYFCNRGFELKGSQVRNCLFNGQWSGSEPICKSRYYVFIKKLLIKYTPFYVIIMLFVYPQKQFQSADPSHIQNMDMFM